MSRIGIWLLVAAAMFSFSGKTLAYTESGNDGSTCTAPLEAMGGSLGKLFTAPDTITAVVIYCKQWDRQKKLPVWKAEIWDTLQSLSVSTFFNQNTNGKFKLIAKAYGQNGLIDGEPQDTLPFMSDSNVNWVKGQPGGGSVFFNNIWTKADQVIDFSQFVEPGDSVVPMVFFHIIDQWKGGGATAQWGLSIFDPDSGSRGTNNTLPNGKRVYVSPGITACSDSSYGQGAAVGVLSHEFGHLFKDFIRDSLKNANPSFNIVPGLQDLHGDAFDSINYWGVGAFSLMGFSSGFQFRPSPIDPYHRTAMRLTNLITVNSPTYYTPIPDYFRSDTVYKLKADEREYFLVSNHKTSPPSFWEANFPGSGALILHVVDSLKCQICEWHKNVDIESPRGLYKFNFPCSLDPAQPNDSLGSDSLDQQCFFVPWPNGPGSGGFLWSHLTKQYFDDKTNPSARAYQLVSNQWMQNRFTKVAALEMGIGDPAHADLIVNARYGRISSNTTWGPGTVSVIGDVTVDSGITLTIAPGTTIKFQWFYDNLQSGGDPGRSRLLVKGTLNAIGGLNASDSIILTTSSGSVVPGSWGGVLVAHPGRLNMTYSRISFADTAIVVLGDTATVKLRNCTFTHFKTMAVYSKSAKTNLGDKTNYNDCGKNNFLIKTAQAGAIAVAKTATPSGTLMAEGNWWDSTTPPAGWFSGSVDYSPYLRGMATRDSCPSGGSGCGEGGEGLCFKVEAVDASRPLKFELGQNYPNPFNAATVIRFSLPEPSRVELRIYNILGQAIRTLVDEKPSGVYEVLWDGRDESGVAVASGLYFYQFRAGSFLATKKMHLVK